MKIAINEIVIEDRIREDLKGTKEEWSLFKNSFLIHGQLQPIKVQKLDDNGRYKLLAGERRLTAIKEHFAEGRAVPGLPDGHIKISFDEPVPLHKQLMQEFAENNDRKDFTYVEKAKFIRKFHEIMVLDMGDAWTQELTAHSLGLSPASISHYLRVEEAVKKDPSIAKAGTLDAAVKRMKVQEKLNIRHDAVKAGDNSALTRAEAVLTNGDARAWILTIPSESIDFINFDPPWGDDVSFKSAENHEAFDDSTEYAEALMDELFPQLYRVLKPDRFCAFWFRAWVPEYMAAKAERFGFNLQFTRTPCIWYKPDKTTDQNRVPEKQLIEAYETFFLLRKGDPVFHERFTHNVFAFDRVPLSAIIHPTEKPLALCEPLLKLCTVPGEVVLDPTAGSSAMLEQALRSNRKATGCELSPNFYSRGITRLAEYLKTFSVK